MISQLVRTSPAARALNIRRCISATSSPVVLDLQDIPTSRGLPFFGTAPLLLANGGVKNLHLYIDQRHKKLGPIFRERVGPIDSVFLCDPKDMRVVFSLEGKYPVHLLPEAWTYYNEVFKVKRGLFFMERDEWWRYRKIFNKYMLKGDFEWVERACEVVSDELITRWDLLCRNEGGIVPELETQLYRWSIDVMLSIILGAKDYKNVKIEINNLVDLLAKNIYLIFKTSASLQLISARLAAKLRLPIWNNFVKVMNSSLQSTNLLVNKLIEEYSSEDGLLGKMKKENIAKDDLVRLLADFLIAAGDTTAYTMEWLLYCVASHKNVQENVRQNNKENSYLRSVIKESLRLYPVAPFITRILTQGITIRGYQIPAGTLVVLSVYTSGRDPQVFKNPQLFLPERWSREDNSNDFVSMQHSTLTFGFGSRSCIGRKVAEMQLQRTMGKIIDKFDLDIVNKEDVKMILNMVAVPSKPLQLRLSQRES